MKHRKEVLVYASIGVLMYALASIALSVIYRFPLILSIIEIAAFSIVIFSLGCIYEILHILADKRFLVSKLQKPRKTQHIFLLPNLILIALVIGVLSGLIWGPILVEVLYPVFSTSHHFLSGETKGVATLRYSWGRVTDFVTILLHFSILWAVCYRKSVKREESHLSKYLSIVIMFLIISISLLIHEDIYDDAFQYEIKQLLVLGPNYVGIICAIVLINFFMLGSKARSSATFMRVYLIMIVLLVPMSFVINILIVLLENFISGFLNLPASLNKLGLHERNPEDVVRVLAGSSRQVFHYVSLVCGTVLYYQYFSGRQEAIQPSNDYAFLPESRHFWKNNTLMWAVFILIMYVTELWRFSEISRVDMLLKYVPLSLTGMIFLLLARYIIHANAWVLSSFNQLLPRIIVIAIAMGVSLFVIDSFYEILLKSFGVNSTRDLPGQLPDQILFFNPEVYFKVILYILWFFIWCFGYASFINYQNKMKLALRAANIENENKLAQLSLLKSQLDPHFIFNSLTGIRYLINQNPDYARESLSRLSDLLRGNLSHMRLDKVTLSEELRLVSDYVAIAKIQLEDKLIYQEDIEEGLQSCFVPTMVIQMLIENAIKHGVSSVIGVGYINLSVSRHHKTIQVIVENSYSDGGFKGVEGLGIGLKNIAERIQLIYGGNATFRFEKSTDIVKSMLVIPDEFTHESSCN